MGQKTRLPTWPRDFGTIYITALICSIYTSIIRFTLPHVHTPVLHVYPSLSHNIPKSLVMVRVSIAFGTCVSTLEHKHIHFFLWLSPDCRMFKGQTRIVIYRFKTALYARFPLPRVRYGRFEEPFNPHNSSIMTLKRRSNLICARALTYNYVNGHSCFCVGLLSQSTTTSSSVS